MLWVVIKKFAGQSLSWWMEVLLFLVCITLGVLLEMFDDRKVKADIVHRKTEASSEQKENEKDR